jgi:hypothetical protein
MARTGGASYVIMTSWGCEVHLTQAGAGPWRVPAENNPFGVFIRTHEVEAIAARVHDAIRSQMCSSRPLCRPKSPHERRSSDTCRECHRWLQGNLIVATKRRQAFFSRGKSLTPLRLYFVSLQSIV